MILSVREEGIDAGLLGRMRCQWSVAAVVPVLYAGGENAGKQKGKEKNKGRELGYLMLAMSFQLLEGGISKMEVNDPEQDVSTVSSRNLCGYYLTSTVDCEKKVENWVKVKDIEGPKWCHQNGSSRVWLLFFFLNSI